MSIERPYSHEEERLKKEKEEFSKMLQSIEIEELRIAEEKIKIS